MADLSILQMTRVQPADGLILPGVDPSAPTGLKNIAVTIADLIAAAVADVPAPPVTKVAGRTGAVTLGVADVDGGDFSTAEVLVSGANVKEALAASLSSAVRIEAFGGAADGSDITAALVAACAAGVPVLFGPHTYVVNGECDIPTDAVLVGVPGATVITRSAVGSAGTAASAAEAYDNAAWIYFTGANVFASGIIFDGNSALTSSGTWGVVVSGSVVRSRFVDCVVRNVQGDTYFQDGLRYLSNSNAGPHRLRDCDFKGNHLNGFTANAVQTLELVRCHASGNGQAGIQIDEQDKAHVLAARDIKVLRCTATGNGSDGIQIGDASYPGSSDPTVKYGLQYMRVQNGLVFGCTATGNGGYDMIVAGSSGIGVSFNTIGAAGFNGNCTRGLRFSDNDVTGGTGGIGVDLGGAQDWVCDSNVVTGFTIGLTVGGSINGRAVRNHVLATTGSCIAVENIEAGYGGNFGLVSAGLRLEGNTLDFSAGQSGIELLNAPNGVEVFDNTFIDSASRWGQTITGAGPFLRYGGNRLRAQSGASAVPTIQVQSAGAVTVPAGFDVVALVAGGAGSAIDSLRTSIEAAVAGQVTGGAMTAGGSGYGTGTTMTITGDGTGAAGTAIVYGGAIIGVQITAAGSGYTTASVSFAGTGSGAAATLYVGATADATDIDQRFELINRTGATLPIGAGFGSAPGVSSPTLLANRRAIISRPAGVPILDAF